MVATVQHTLLVELLQFKTCFHNLVDVAEEQLHCLPAGW